MRQEIDYVARFMIEHNVVVPMSVIGVTIALMCLISIILFLTKSTYAHFIRNASLCLLIGYIFLSLCATIFFRNESLEIRYSLQPLKSYTMIYSKMMAENILNILFFVPIGFLSGVVLKTKGVFFISFIGFLLSLAIETIQLFTKRGVCNVDDIINNTIGCAIGYTVFRLGQTIWTTYIR